VPSDENLTVTPTDDDPGLLMVDGLIDSHTVTVLESALGELAPHTNVAVDLSKVSFVDSSGLRVLVQAHNRHAESGGGFSINDPSEPVVRLLNITGLTDHLTING
jgi:anti-sigma B factor antagonist